MRIGLAVTLATAGCLIAFSAATASPLPSLLTSAEAIVRGTALMEEMARNSCTIDPDFPRWEIGSEHLKESTQLALEQAFTAGIQDFVEKFPSGSDLQMAMHNDAHLCLDDLPAVYDSLRRCAKVFMALKRHGY